MRIKFVTGLILAILILLGTMFQIPTMFKSGQIGGDGTIGYWGPLARDGVWHEALVGAIDRNLVPENPGLSGVKLQNYHYFYDLLVSKIAQFSSLSPNFVIYRLFPIIFSMALGVGTYLFSVKLFEDKKTALLSVFFAYFASSLGWIIELIKRGSAWGGESAFWANQPVSMNLNPPFAISLVMIIFILILLSKFFEKPRKSLGLILIVLSGVLIGFKVYAGVIILASLFLLSVKRFVRNNNSSLFFVFASALTLSFAIYMFESRGAESLLIVQPFWLIDTMIDAGDRVGIPNFTSRRFTYQSGGKWVHFVALQTLCFLIFLVGNLGTRFLAIKGFSKKYFANDIHLFVLFAMLVSFVPPLIFIQKGNAWNIVQFFYYFLFFASLYAAHGVIRIYKSLGVSAGVIFMSAVILLTPISSIATFRSSLYPNPVAYLSKEELEGLKFLKLQGDGIVLKHSFDKSLRAQFKDPFPLMVYADNAYVSAYSGKSVFVEDVEQQIILNTDYKGRLVDTDRFFVEKNPDWSNGFLKENNISYIYLPKIYRLPMAESEYDMKKIFENNEVNIYKVVR